MIPIKQYIADQFINRNFHFICDCLIPINVKGFVKDYKITNNEIILYILISNNKLVQIGLNTPSLQINPL